MAIANTVLIHKKSATPGSTPSSLANGEIALNFADGKLYFKNLGGATTYFYANGFSTVTANGTSLIPTAPNQTLTFSAGNNISITTNTTTQTINIALSNTIVTSGTINVTNTTASTSNLTGALVVAGGIGVSGNVYVGGRVGWANSNSVSVVYQYYNSVTASLDTVFG